jgi:hypothetical protein
MPSFSPWPPVTFAWVNPTETTFTSAHERMDEAVVDFDMTHSEGNAPTLAVTIKNPYVGLVGSGRKYWVWMSYVRNGTYVPFFFGRLIATPDNIQDEAITLQFLARSRIWLKLKQHISDLLRVDPYDPILVSVDQRADPDTVLQFRSALWHFDRVPTLAHGATAPDLNISISDILEPEDGFLSFAPSDHFYKAFNWKIGQQPLQKVQMRSDVRWTQSGAGFVDIPSGPVTCWTGGSIVSGWPKPGTGLSGGYTVAYATAFSGTEYAVASSHHFHWENLSKTHLPGDMMSEEVHWTTYTAAGDLLRYQIFQQVGINIPTLPASWSQDGFMPGPTDPVNIPLHVSWSEMMVCFWFVSTTLGLEYDVQRPRHEKIQFNLDSSLQPVFTDTHEPASLDTEVVTMPGADVGLPVINVVSWYTLSIGNLYVAPGTYVVSTPEAVGGPYFAVAIGGGYVGTTEPAWTLVLGQFVTDGSVTWAMVGATIPTDFPTWRDVAGASVSAGLVIRAQFYLPPPHDIFGTPAIAPPAGTSSFQVATNNGTTQIYSNGLNGVADLHPSWPEPHFSSVQGAITSDGSVNWMSLGTGAGINPVLDLPLGLNTGARWFYPLDRGQRTIRALINAARAKLRMRARVIKFDFETTIERGLDMSCRKGVLIYDHRIPGGSAFGKITSYTLSMDGDKAQVICKCTAEASTGFGAVSGFVLPPPGSSGGSPPPAPTSPPSGVTVIPGTGTYALPGYMLNYQQTTGGRVIVTPPPSSPPTPGSGAIGAMPTTGNPLSSSSVASDDVGYTPPSSAGVIDDGVSFPITNASKLILTQRWITGLPPGAPQYVANAVFTVQALATDIFGNTTEFTLLLPVPNGYTPVVLQQQFTGFIPPAAPVPISTPSSSTSTIITTGQGSVTTLPGGAPVPSSGPTTPTQSLAITAFGGQSTVTYVYYYPVTQYFLELTNLNKPFANEYFVQTTPLTVPEMVNLQ